MLSALVKQGSVLRVQIGEETRYRVRLQRKQGRVLAEHIWQALEECPPIVRAAALLSALVVSGMPIVAARRGAFNLRTVVEMRDDAFALSTGGKPSSADAVLTYPDGEQCYHTSSSHVSAFSSLRSATFQFPGNQAKELNVWAHRITSSGDSKGLPAVAQVQQGAETNRFDLKLCRCK